MAQSQSTAVEAPPLLLRVEEVARLTGLCRATIFRRADSGEMPQRVKIGHASRWRRADIEAWIEAGCPRVDRRKGACA